VKSKKTENGGSEVKSNGIDDNNLPLAQNGKNANLCSDLEGNASAGSPKTPEEQFENQTTARGSSQSSKNPTGSEVSGDESPTEEQNSVAKPNGSKRIEQTSVRKATGPRTPAGKQNSKFNALKHGLLSKAVLSKTESRDEYRSLLNGLCEYWQPHGKMESVLVENIAAVFWRLCRSLQGESSEISERIEFMAIDSATKQLAEIWENSEADSGGVFKWIDNPLFIREEIERFAQLRETIIKHGFKTDFSLIEKLYGKHPSGSNFQAFRLLYEDCAAKVNLAEKGGDKSKDAELRQAAIEIIDPQIESLKDLEKRAQDNCLQRLRYKLYGAVISGQVTLDLRLRYEAHLSRGLDRYVNLLVQLQRMRQGQP